MKKITIQLRRDEADALEKIFKKYSLDYSTDEREGRFIPSPWKEIIVSLAPILIKILYDFIKSKKSKTKVIIKTDDSSFELEAENIKRLELLLDKDQKKKRGKKP